MSICHALYSSRTAVHMDFLWLWCGISQESCWADKLANRALEFQVHECVHLLRELEGKVLENRSAESTNHGGNSLFMVYPSLLEIKQLVLSDFGSACLMLHTATGATNLLQARCCQIPTVQEEKHIMLCPAWICSMCLEKIQGALG